MRQSSKPSVLCSALLHVVAIALVLILTTGHPAPIAVAGRAIFGPEKLYMPLVRTWRSGSAGGGGQNALTRPSKGHPPKPATRVFTAPVFRIGDTMPLLPVEPTILATQAFPALELPTIGVPDGVDGPSSPGRGKNNGFGDGEGGGNGSGNGPYYGTGDGGAGGAGGLRSVTTQPVLLNKKEPEYSEEARKVRLQGTVALTIEIDARGVPQNIRVQQGLGLGLDERAVEAVRGWRFRPATRNGKPVTSAARVDVTFRLL